MNIPNWSKAWPTIDWQAQLKKYPEDFIVNEVLSFSFDENKGEHLYLQIQKRLLTTQQVVELLADYFNLTPESIGYAGLKDKHAITTQWFSVWLPGKDRIIDCEMLEASKLIRATDESAAECQILKACWHLSKLRKGAIQNNSFKILCRGEEQVPDQIEQQLKQIKMFGFPNYFGDQRFGWNGKNIENVQLWFESKSSKLTEPSKRFQQGMLLSTARSFLFNHLLQSRVEQLTWNKALEGDCFILEGSRKYFIEKDITAEIIKRCESADIHPTAVLWGNGGSQLLGVAELQQQQTLKSFKFWCQALEKKGVDSSQRALRCIPYNLTWQIIDKTHLMLCFELPSGSFATSLIRELGNISQY